MTRIALNRSLVLWTNPVYKTSWASAASQQLVLVQVSTWRSYMIGVIKFSKADHGRFLLIHVNKLLITAQPIRNLRTPASAEMNRMGFLQQGSLTLSLQSPSLFPFLPIRPLPLLTPATQANNWLIFSFVFIFLWAFNHHIIIMQSQLFLDQI